MDKSTIATPVRIIRSPDRPVIMHAGFLSHPDLDAECWGILAYFYALPDDTTHQSSDIAAAAKITPAHLETIAKRLVDAGYLGLIDGGYTVLNPWPPVPEQPPTLRKAVYIDLSGYVYLILASTGHYKIGRTKSYKDRMKLFGVQLPFTFEFIHVIQTEDMYTLESKLHERFASKRVNGEWFSLTDEDVAYIKSLA